MLARDLFRNLENDLLGILFSRLRCNNFAIVRIKPDAYLESLREVARNSSL